MSNRAELLASVADAIEAAKCPGREGPYGLYDFSAYRAGSPYAIRDFRPGAPDYGCILHRFDDAEEARRVYRTMTREYVAEAAVKAMTDWLSKGTPYA